MNRAEDDRDQQLVESTRRGEPWGYAGTLERYGGRVTGYLRRRFPTLDEHELQDTLSDALLASAESFDAGRGTLPAWFLFLAHQQAVARIRSRRSRPAWESLEADRAPASGRGTPLDQLVTEERVHEMEHVIQSLSTLEQAVIEADLAEGGAVAAEDLADRLQTTPGSVYAARQRARRKLLARCTWIKAMLGEGNSP
jgi:DNA-directed RNA polymerase specialized sigma24 family protein